MLDMGFYDDIMQVYKLLPATCQTIMFSATMPPKIRTLAQTILKNPEEVKIAISRPPETIMQTAYVCYDMQKLRILEDLFSKSRPQRVIIFSSSKMKVKELASTLKRMKFNVAAMHSDLEQSQREEVMKEFKNGRIDILVATDVVSRGIDINDIKLVINFDIPHDPEDYVHRIGRTGRAGNTGVAMTFITPREFRQLKLIERTVKTKIQRRQLPTAANVIERQRDQIISKMQTVLELNAYHDYMPIAESLLDDYSAEEVAAAALKLMQEGIKALEAPQEDILSKDLRNTGGRPGMVRLFINIGRSQKIMVKDIVSTIAIEADIPARDIGLINIYDKFTFVEVPEDVAEKVIGAMNKNFIKGYKVNIEPAKARR